MNRRELSPALLGSLALHALVAAALLISWPFPKDLKLGSAVPVTLVADGPAEEPPAAMQAPEPQPAQAEQPVPQAPPEPVPPAPQPAPTPPAPKPAPAPPKPAKTAEKAPPKPEKSLDLDALAASLSKMPKSAAGKPSSAPKGPARAATAPLTGAALTAAAQGALNGIKDQVERRWNPNCDVAGGRDVQVSVVFMIDAAGQVAGDVRSQIRSAPNAVARAAADRAVRAVYAAAPFRNLPRELYGQSFKLNFDAKDACS